MFLCGLLLYVTVDCYCMDCDYVDCYWVVCTVCYCVVSVLLCGLLLCIEKVDCVLLCGSCVLLC